MHDLNCLKHTYNSEFMQCFNSRWASLLLPSAVFLLILHLVPLLSYKPRFCSFANFFLQCGLEDLKTCISGWPLLLYTTTCSCSLSCTFPSFLFGVFVTTLEWTGDAGDKGRWAPAGQQAKKPWVVHSHPSRSLQGSITIGWPVSPITWNTITCPSSHRRAA